MNLNRRNFLRASLSALVGAAVIPRIPLPAPPPSLQTIHEAMGADWRAMNCRLVADNFFKTPFFEYLKRSEGFVPFDGGEYINAPIFKTKTYEQR